VGKPEGKRLLGDLDVDERSANCISSILERGQETGSCRHGNKPSGIVKYWKFPLLAGELLVSQKAFCSMDLVGRLVSRLVGWLFGWLVSQSFLTPHVSVSALRH
jgi:hypothetical protein